MATRSRAPQPTEEPRAFGERAPRWLAVALGVLGALVIAAGAWAYTADGSGDGDGDGGAGDASAATEPAAAVHAEATTTAATADTSSTSTRATTAATTTVAPTTTTSAAPTTTAATVATTVAETVVATTVAAPPCPAPADVAFVGRGTRPVIAATDTRLADLATWAVQHLDARLVVAGHTGASGDDEANLVLSYRRATVVAGLLHLAGVDDGQVQRRAAGELEPLPGEDPAGAANERVTVTATSSWCPGEAT